jgi:polyhydroxybutyrate depolymerase
MRKIGWPAVAVVVVVVVGAASFALVHTFDGSAQPAKASTATSAPAQRAKAIAQSALGEQSAEAISAAAAGARTQTYSLKAAGLTRKYTVIKPEAALAKSAPIIVMLQGVGSTVAQEITRDQLTPYASAGKAEIVYPWAEGESWNAGGCCGYAYQHKVNDQAFLKAVVAQVNPGNARKIYVVGYSNGARMAYRIACGDPTLFDAYAMVKGVPTAGCSITKPVTVIQLAAVNDPEIPYQPGDKGLEPLPVTTLMSRMRSADKCPSASAETRTQDLTETTWSGCGGGTRLVFAVWSTGVHSFPRPPASTPGASPVIWAFFTKTKLAGLPA